MPEDSAIAMRVMGRERPVLSYSMHHLLYFWVLLLVLFVFDGFLNGYAWSDPLPMAVSLPLLGAGLYYSWVRSLRSVRFYEDHFEVSGWKVRLTAKYSDLEDLSKARRVLGDYKSDGTLRFSVRGNPNVFSMPNRIFGKPKVELYSFLLLKTHAGRPLSIKEFLTTRESRNDERRTLAVGYYLQNFNGLRCFSAQDIEKGFWEAQSKPPSNISDKIHWNVRHGFMLGAETTRDGLPAFLVTNQGMQAVEVPPGQAVVPSR